MKSYSIVRVGHDYVVQADDQSVLKLSSRRRAAKLVSDAAVLLDRSPASAVVDDGSPGCDPDIPAGASKAG